MNNESAIAILLSIWPEIIWAAGNENWCVSNDGAIIAHAPSFHLTPGAYDHRPELLARSINNMKKIGISSAELMVRKRTGWLKHVTVHPETLVRVRAGRKSYYYNAVFVRFAMSCGPVRMASVIPSFGVDACFALELRAPDSGQLLALVAEVRVCAETYETVGQLPIILHAQEVE